MLHFLYHTLPGRLLLKPLTSPAVSRLCGRFLDSPFSRFLIGPFVRRNEIRLSDYDHDDFHSFNECFSRKIKPELRPINMDPDTLISPCDGLLSVYSLDEITVFPVKQSQYTITSLLRDETLARRYSNGVCFVFRLCVDHYHRYCYAQSGRKTKNVFLPGRLHTVRPVALETISVFTENSREYTIIDSQRFGPVLQMEVGALLVGKIKNHHPEPTFVNRGEEKGTFLYGGSTVILLLEKDRLILPKLYLDASSQGEEVPVRMGQPIGKANVSLNH